MEQNPSHGETIARECFAQIAARFPLLQIQSSEAGLELTICPQLGLAHQVFLTFQEPDELHLLVGHFWLEWFPCTNPERAMQYVAAVSGFLDGTYRVVEHFRGADCVKAQLQRPSQAGWEVIGTWSKLHWPSLRRARQKVLANA